MLDGNNKDLDKLITRSLDIKSTPTITLNEELKRKIRNGYKEKRQISIWWLPTFISITISIITCIYLYLFMENQSIKNLLIMLNIFNLITNVLATFIGLKYLDLKKGAIIDGI